MANKFLSFRYPADIQSTLEPWRQKLGSNFDSVVAHLSDRDRALEDYVAALLPQLAQRVTVARVETAELTTGTTYGDLATIGPTVTVNIGSTGLALVWFGADISATSTQGFMSYAISGATTLAAADDHDVTFFAGSTSGVASVAGCQLQSGLNPGATTFTAKYRHASGATLFDRRFIVVQPF